MRDDEFESRILRFDRARQVGPAEIADHLHGLAGPDRARLLVELICVDLEYAWRGPRAARPTALEDYLGRFPELASPDLLPIELVGEEYRARCRWGDRPSREDVLSRFPGRREAILAELLRVDAEIEAESAGPLPAPGRLPPEGDDPGPDVAGPVLSDRDYLLLRMIGAGRMGKVYEVRCRADGRDVAVKFLRKSLLRHRGAVGRFVAEARTVAGLRHPNIVATEGLGRTRGGSYFIVMDRVRGPDLARVVARRSISVDEAIRWTMEACDAIEHAHRRGIVHCDLKPANLLLDEAERVRVADFGLARSIAGETPWAWRVEGTAPFMAPEQADPGRGPIDRRTDVYGVGAVLFALLTGLAPFDGRRLPDILARVVGPDPAPSPAALRDGLPGPVVEICRRCLAKAPNDRFPTVGAVRAALDAAWQGGP